MHTNLESGWWSAVAWRKLNTFGFWQQPDSQIQLFCRIIDRIDNHYISYLDSRKLICTLSEKMWEVHKPGLRTRSSWAKLVSWLHSVYLSVRETQQNQKSAGNGSGVRRLNFLCFTGRSLSECESECTPLISNQSCAPVESLISSRV